ncbi:TonB-linked SusC/RagA family outer membrane protein [Chitinophaga terrae (ex Kim and Jung 2007)]|uniref:SusC/RagA family TonB-linked outer membrane protein n=1 Tax=Chitinophaga terrae (ex Kim and Jung 2007) TaxID=408074 RepID=UPI00277DE829|nr:SusC/RagA family TonB-linked outer membrane protein [Chitinophaga terrae (ex Kim and Jung 2007)]MDQ0107500.1 TonB-linked SusC/RagA family outer membrane protein [Chitinophaga terrae (ex Kim and Jung 2007)]
MNANAAISQGGKKVTLNVTNLPTREVFKQITRQTGMAFFYPTQDLALPKAITITVIQKPLEEVLNLLFKGTKIDWEFNDNVISLRAKAEPAHNSPPVGDSSINSISVTGKVIAADGTPIPGATVLVKRTKDGATTDEEGNFHLSNVRIKDVLQIRSIGYQVRELEVTGKSLNAIMAIDINTLDETQIIAYGTTTKRFNTGNVSTVKAEDIEKQPISNPLQALQGRVPGIEIVQQTGVPGGGYKVQIRGQNSLRPEGNYPLYVIDGVPYSSTLLPSIGGSILGRSSDGSVGNPLNYINPSDIERIDILKDADATAIFGSRGANGVILITTKKGTAGKTNINVNFNKGIGKVTRKMSLLNTEQYINMRREAFKNDNAIPQTWNAPDLLIWDTTAYTDWQKTLIGGTANYTDAQASISGGSPNIQYLIGAGYHKETTVYPGDLSDQKGNFHFSINSVSQNQKFKATLTGNYVADRNNLANYDFMSSITEAPNTPSIYKEDGSINFENSTWQNPLARLLWKYKNRTNNLLSNAVFSYSILKGLELKTSLGYTDMQVQEITTYPISSFDPAFNVTTGSSSFANNNITTWIAEPQISYRAKIGKGEISLLLGSSFQRTDSRGQILNASGISDDALLESLKAASDISVQSESNIQYKYFALFSRINYNLAGKYLLNITARRDGSSRFGPGKQYANFGAIGAAWVFTEEKLLKDALHFISFGKLRASYGTTGSDQIKDYGFLSLYNSTQYPYLGSIGLYPVNLYNPDFAWEVNRKFESGLELGILKDRILFSSSFFRNRSSNQLVGQSLPPSTGFTSVTANLPAVVQNTGFEFAVNSRNITLRTFSWQTNFNLTVSRNKLISYPGIENSTYSNSYVVGESLSIQKVYHLIGVDDETGQYLFSDKDGKPTLTPDYANDRIILMNLNPKYYGGIQNSLTFKGFHLDFLFQFVKQLGTNVTVFNLPGIKGINQPLSVLKRWQQPGDITNIQRFNQNSSIRPSNDNALISDFALSDASFIRLKNLSLSFQLPENIQRRFHTADCRIYIQAQNLLTFTKYKGFDPENQTARSLPPLRVVITGIKITL